MRKRYPTLHEKPSAGRPVGYAQTGTDRVPVVVLEGAITTAGAIPFKFSGTWEIARRWIRNVRIELGGTVPLFVGGLLQIPA